MTENPVQLRFLKNVSRAWKIVGIHCIFAEGEINEQAQNQELVFIYHFRVYDYVYDHFQWVCLSIWWDPWEIQVAVVCFFFL